MRKQIARKYFVWNKVDMVPPCHDTTTYLYSLMFCSIGAKSSTGAILHQLDIELIADYDIKMSVISCFAINDAIVLVHNK